MKFHHLAYLVRDTARSLEAFKRFFPETTLVRSAHDLQGAFITYMSTADGKMTIELVEPFENNRLLAGKLDREKQDCLPYHICLSVDNFKTECKEMRQHGWITLTRPFDCLGNGMRASHLYNPAAGIVEIIGANRE